MPTLVNIKDRFGNKRWPTPLPLDRKFTKTGQRVKLGQCLGGSHQGKGMVGTCLANLAEQVNLAVLYFVIRTVNLLFVFFEFHRDIAFSIFKSLAALIIRWNPAGVGMGDLYVVAKDRVEPDL